MDRVFESWLERQCADAVSLCGTSDVVTVAPEVGPRPPRRFLAQFASPTMVKVATDVTSAIGFAAVFQFPPDYLRSASDVAQIVNLLAPSNVFHPNVAPPFICIGHIAPGTGLCELIYQVHEILTFNKLTPREDDALNHDACVWARGHMHLFPLSAAPLRRRTHSFLVDEIQRAEAPRESDGI